MKVAVVGMAPSCADAPWSDSSWQKWGLPWHPGYWAQCDRHFEMHDMRLLLSEHSTRGDDYLERLSQCPHLYMQEAYAQVPTARRYPFEDVSVTTGYYWNSSVAYALAMAIHEGADQIGLWGVDMRGEDEYGYQKPNMEYLVGLAKGRGIDVYIPDSSPLLKFNPTGIRFCKTIPVYEQRYGWLGD